MKKHISLFSFLLCSLFSVVGQNFSVGADKNNILYVGIDNPLSIAVENLSSKSIIVRVDKGNITGKNGRYIFNADNPGLMIITLYRKENRKLKEIGKNYFRIKNLPDPIFKIASGKDSMRKIELEAQQYVRAELEGFDFDVKYSVLSFTVCTISTDPCRYVEKNNNEGNKVSEEIRDEFRKLKQNDIVIFKNIICSGPEGRSALKSIMITIFE